MQTNSPIFIIPNIQKSAEDIESLIGRFDLYGQRFRQVSGGGKKLLIFLGISELDFKKIDQNYFDSLEIHRISNPTQNFFLFALKSKLKCNALKIRPYLLISSDLYFGFLTSLFFRIINRHHVRIQVSIHGATTRAEDGLLFGRVRNLYLQFVFRQSSSVRVVSDHLKLQLLEDFGVPNCKISISPIPVDFPRIDLTETRSNIIAFVGRVHIERGLSEWAKIISLLYKMRTDFEVYVIGAGPRSEEFSLSLNCISKDLVIRNFGYLHRKDLETKWKFIKVLLSSAPSEGYGLTIREAVVAGAFVCARTSEGSKNLSNQLPDLVRTYDSPDEAAAILSTLLNENFPTVQAKEYIEELFDQNFQNVETLVKSWI